MTEQTKKFIEASDIVGMRFECSHEGCGAVLVLPLKPESLMGDVIKSCPSCGREWAVERSTGARGQDSRQLFKTLVEAIKGIRYAPVKFSFSLEISAD